MPFSIDPQPGENEIECARCGAVIYYELTRCPECDVNLYEPDDELDDENYGSFVGSLSHQEGVIAKVGKIFRRLLGKPYSAEEVFGDSLNQAILCNDLLVKVGGDHKVVERLIEFESKAKPDGNRIEWIQNAIQRWERDNRIIGYSKTG